MGGLELSHFLFFLVPDVEGVGGGGSIGCGLVGASFLFLEREVADVGVDEDEDDDDDEDEDEDDDDDDDEDDDERSGGSLGAKTEALALVVVGTVRGGVDCDTAAIVQHDVACVTSLWIKPEPCALVD